MKALCLLLLPVLGLLVSSQTLCSMEEAVNEKIQEGASSLVFRAIRSIGLECQSVTSRGDLATCPRGECRSLLSRRPSLFQVPWECHLPTTFPMSSLYPARILVLTPSLLCPPSGHWCPPPLPASSAHSVVGASSPPPQPVRHLEPPPPALCTRCARPQAADDSSALRSVHARALAVTCGLGAATSHEPQRTPQCNWVTAKPAARTEEPAL
nr:resistin [Macaca nemestrina]